MQWDTKLKNLVKRSEFLGTCLSSGQLSGEVFQKYAREHGSLEEIVPIARQYFSLKATLKEADQLMQDVDEEIVVMAREECESIKRALQGVEKQLKVLMLPKDEADARNVILEIRAGTGGEEASLFVATLLRMYRRYAERRRWKLEILEENLTDLGGYSFVSMGIVGKNVYAILKYESGGHRVQRIPETESGGRIHTSAATVAVLPEAQDVDVEINPGDLRIDTYRSSGAGGQHVNTTDSAVRITHLPSGMVARCQSQRSQHKNKEQAMKMLRAMIYDHRRQKAQQEIARDRRMQVGSGDRSQRIKTYNFPQGRVTDHRINLTLYKLEKILDGDLGEILEAVIAEDNLRRLATFAEQ